MAPEMEDLRPFLEAYEGNPLYLLLSIATMLLHHAAIVCFNASRDALIARLLTWAVLSALSFIDVCPKYGISIFVHAVVFLKGPWNLEFCRRVFRAVSRDGADERHAWYILTGTLSVFVYDLQFLALANYSVLYACIRPWLPWLCTIPIMVIAVIATSVYYFEASVFALFSMTSNLLFQVIKLLLHAVLVMGSISGELYMRLDTCYQTYRACKTRFLGNERPVYCSQPFVYTPMDESQNIRLLRVSKRGPFSEFTCDIIHTTLDQAPAYEAISYHWGDPIADHKLIVNGRALEVTARVSDIVRSRASFFGAKLLWIDGVCINQTDLKEKARQLLLMRDIYRSARRVLVWLGTDPDASHAIRYMMTVLAELQLSTKFKIWRELIGVQSTDNRSPALFKLLDHPWWSRVWIIQEIAMAKEVVVFYGNGYYTWYTFERYLRLAISLTPLQIGSFIRSDLSSLTQIPAYAYRMPMLKAIRDRCQTPNASWDLRDVLRLAQTCQASNPRDKVYALLGLTTAIDGTQLAPDYSKSTAEVFTDTARCLCAHDLFRTLAESGVGRVRSTSSLPSWVPDYAVLQDISPLHVTSSQQEAEASYRASGDSQVSYELHPSLPVLRMACLLFDSITVLGPACTFRRNGIKDIIEREAASKASFWNTVDFIRDSIGPSGCYVFTGQPCSEVTWRIVIGDRSTIISPIQRPAPDVYRDHFVTVSNIMDESRDRARKGSGASNWSDDITRLLCEPGSAPHEGFAEFAITAGEAGTSNRLAMTQRGALCLVPLDTRVADVVGVMKGAQACSLLRKQVLPGDADGVVTSGGGEKDASRNVVGDGWTRPQWRFVGNCYVHGFMDGEALSSSNHHWQDVYIW